MSSKLAKFKKLSLRNLRFKSLPDSPGVYIFWQKETPVYIGKAIDLKSRLRSYFSLKLAPKTSRMIKEADSLSYIKVTSEMESLLLEAKLIRAFQPRYNSASKDDKHPLYIRITGEKYPRVLTARKIEAKEKNLAFFGPFPSSNNVRSVLRLVRRVFPYSDHKVGVRPCLYSHIGLCNPCPSVIEKEGSKLLFKIYKRNIRRIKAVLAGRLQSVRKDLVKEMLEKAKEEKYEEALALKDQIEKLNYITQAHVPSQAFLSSPNLFEDIRAGEVRDLTRVLSPLLKISSLMRIECFDVAHLAGENATASMVTFIKGEAEKSLYRHFRIYGKKKRDDISALNEVIVRRKKYLGSWGSPDLIIVDGGKGQVSVFHKALRETGIPVVGLAKREETLVIPVIYEGYLQFKEIRVPRGPARNLLQRIRDEAHRFARRYHHLLVKKTLLKFS